MWEKYQGHLSKENWYCSCNLEMGQKWKVGVCAQNFQRTRIGLCIKVIYMQLMTSHKVCGIFKELFNMVVVQQKHLKN